jgi:hypothetical protein
VAGRVAHWRYTLWIDCLVGAKARKAVVKLPALHDVDRKQQTTIRTGVEFNKGQRSILRLTPHRKSIAPTMTYLKSTATKLN